MTFAVPPAELQPKLPPDMNICVAFDYMHVRVAEIKHMTRFIPALTALFESEHPEVAESAATERDRNAVINNTGRKLSHQMYSMSEGGDVQKKAAKADSSGSDSSGEGKSRRREKREKKQQTRKEKKRVGAEKQKEQDERGKARRLVKEQRMGDQSTESADLQKKPGFTQEDETMEDTERLKSTG